MLFDYVEDTQLIGRLGLRNSSAAYWVGLIEPDWAGFVLHYLRSDDVFYDVGANIGIFTILGGVVRDAECVAFEPVPETFSYLEQNLRLNGSPKSIRLLNQGVGKERGTLRFTSNEGATNHVLAAGEQSRGAIELPVTTLEDAAQSYSSPSVLKVDVEGFEHDVLQGAKSVLESPGLNVVMLELRNHGARYGYNENEIHDMMYDYGFTATVYEPFERKFRTWKRESESKLGDVLYVRDMDLATTRVQESKSFRVKGTDL
jgi:FkbM family methyltransferase